MVRFLAHWLSTALALFVCYHVLPGVHIDSYTTLAVASFVLGFVNAIVRPILLLLTLPITILTLGLFYFVVNGVAFGLAAWVVPGFDVDSIGWAILGSIVVSLVSWFLACFTQKSERVPR